MNDNGTPPIHTYTTKKLLEDRHDFSLAASFCRTAMLFDVLIARVLDSEPDLLSDAEELIDVLRENLRAIQIIDAELARRHVSV